ncbi:eCIS core domain-containing protein [Herbaspirillum seropedicae]|uniref:eCIS core domain-containing protein n=1 Tax=Herbaspirillum seropedicae TaxID=964 RepID=UPI003D9A05A5
MNTFESKSKGNESYSPSDGVGRSNLDRSHGAEFVDNRPQASLQRKLQSLADLSPQSQQVGQLKAMMDNGPVQKKENKTGLPDGLKSGVESLSGMSMDHVRVHYNSPQPEQLNAHAYAQGSDIHVAPGQEQHLPHEAWHVVQQAQGRVRPTTQLQGLTVNTDAALEQEADRMGQNAMQTLGSVALQSAAGMATPTVPGIVQAKWVGMEMETQIPIFKHGERTDGVDGYANPPSYEHLDVSPTMSGQLGGGFEFHVDRPERAANATTTLLKVNHPSILEIVTPPREQEKDILGDVNQALKFLSEVKSHRLLSGDGWHVGWPTATAEFSGNTAEAINEALEYDIKVTNPLQYDAQLTFQNTVDALGKIEKNELDEFMKGPC